MIWDIIYIYPCLCLGVLKVSPEPGGGGGLWWSAGLRMVLIDINNRNCNAAAAAAAGMKEQLESYLNSQ